VGILVQSRASVRDDDCVEIPIAELAGGLSDAHIRYHSDNDDRIDTEHAQRLVEVVELTGPLVLFWTTGSPARGATLSSTRQLG